VLKNTYARSMVVVKRMINRYIIMSTRKRQIRGLGWVGSKELFKVCACLWKG
jgi:hypothetical protein